MLHTSFERDCSLFHGKMGVVVFFFHYARFTGNLIYEDFAGELIDEIYAEIDTGVSDTFEHGLCGIAWGIEYLIQRGFVEGDSNTVLAILDQQIEERDVRKIKNIELGSGLKGLLHYVLLRHYNKYSKPVIFDERYITEMLKKLASVGGEDMELNNLIDSLRKIANNEVYEYNADELLKKIIGTTQMEQEEELDLSHPFGLANNGYAGIALNAILSLPAPPLADTLNCQLASSPILPKLYCFRTVSRASAYGIGSYIEQIIGLARQSNLNLTVIELSSTTKEIEQVTEKDYNKLYIPSVIGNIYASSESNNYYCRNIAYLLTEFIPQDEKQIFHLNFMENVSLPVWLKKRFDAKIVLTIHYTSWSFDLLGDRRYLYRILKTKKENNDDFEERIRLKIENDRNMINQCDRVIAIAEQSYKNILNIYGVDKEKIILINNGLKDGYKKLGDSRKQQLKSKYHINPQDRLILFAGRLDEVKGVRFLLKAFGDLLKTEQNVRLILVGEGDFSRWIDQSRQIGSKIIFTGKLDQKELYNFYQLADIGIVCSIHEEFGFVAVEMMMHKLPVIVSDTGGLSEIVEEAVTGLKVKVKVVNKKRGIDVAGLTAKMKYLLHHPDVCSRLGENARNKFVQNYSLPIWSKRMEYLYERLYK